MAAQNATWRLIEIHHVTGRIRVITGLRIGASQESMEISGLDNPVLRNPADDFPYIPGSSIKGKMRSLAEWYFAEIPENGDVIRPRPDSRTARVFGVSAQKEKQVGPTRLLVRDAFLTDEWKDRFRRGEPVAEVKYENSINRLTCAANPRPVERVVPGVEFDFALLYRVLATPDDPNGDHDRRLFDEIVTYALRLLELDYLGSYGSRGSGQIEFQGLRHAVLRTDGTTTGPDPLVLPKLADATQSEAGAA